MIPGSVSRQLKKRLPGQAVSNASAAYERLSPRRLVFLLPGKFLQRFQYPSLLTIALTNRCNLNCFICNRENIPPGELCFDNLAKLNDAIRYARAVNLTGLGESLIYPKFGEVVERVLSLGRKGRILRIITNGTRLSEDTGHLVKGRLQRLTISLNAASAGIYNRDMVPGDFDTTLASIRSCMGAIGDKDRRAVRLHFVAHTRNYEEIPEFVRLASNLKVGSVSIGHFMASSGEGAAYVLLHVKEAYNRLLLEAEALAKDLDIVFEARRFRSETPRSSQGCLSPFHECYVDVDGNVTPCCFAGGHIMGNVYESSFENVWFGESYKRLRKHLNLPSCSDCARLIPLDRFSAHFTASYKRTASYQEEARRHLANASD